MIFDRSGGVWAFPPPSPGLPLPPHGQSGPGRHPTLLVGRVRGTAASGVRARGVSAPALPAAQRNGRPEERPLPVCHLRRALDPDRTGVYT